MASLPTSRTVLPPLGGWAERAYYVVEVAWTATNPIHRAILYTSFLTEEKKLSDFARIWGGGYDAEYRARSAYYLRALHRISSLP